MTRDQHDTFEALATSMARTNGYTAEQSSDLYITDGAIDDWLWGANGVFAFTFEMYPADGLSPGFYPPDEVIHRETARNREAALMLLEDAACPYAAIGRTAQYCGSAPLTTIYAAARPPQRSPAIALTGATNFSLAFKYQGLKRDASLRVLVGGKTVARFSGRNGVQNTTASLSRFAGQTVRVELSGHDATVTGLRVSRY